MPREKEALQRIGRIRLALQFVLDIGLNALQQQFALALVHIVQYGKCFGAADFDACLKSVIHQGAVCIDLQLLFDSVF